MWHPFHRGTGKGPIESGAWVRGGKKIEEPGTKGECRQTKNVLHFVLSPWYFSNALIRLRRTFVAAATFSPREKGFFRLPCAQKKKPQLTGNSGFRSSEDQANS